MDDKKLHNQHDQEEKKLHELHQKQEQLLHEQHLKEEAALHQAHDEEENFLHSQHQKEEQENKLVPITVDGKKVIIERGPEPVETIKIKGGVPLACTLLEEDADGQFLPLRDDGTVFIKGCEVFESHAPCGGSS